MVNFIPVTKALDKLPGQITDKQYEELDQIHYKVENGLISLIKSLQKKHRDGDWQEIFTE